MRVLIAGIDGYLGWALARWLVERGDVEVAGVDALLRREWVAEVGGASVVPIAPLPERVERLERATGARIATWVADLRDPGIARDVVAAVRPDAIVHLAECPSAPYSMIDADHARFVQVNNLMTTFNVLFAVRELDLDAHLVKLGTLGEYGTPGVPIPEGFATLSHAGREAWMPFPRQAGSWYHWSKVHGSNNLMFAAQLWGMRVTDVMQGVVFGVYPERADGDGGDPALATRLDADAVFGTVVHRWCVQAAMGRPMTVYGHGGQRRGFIPLQDSLRCLELLLRNPAAPGEYRVVNQLDQVHRLRDLAERVAAVARSAGLDAAIATLENPRVEREDHPYEVACDTLPALGYTHRDELDDDLLRLLRAALRWRDRLPRLAPVLAPDVRWAEMAAPPAPDAIAEQAASGDAAVAAEALPGARAL